MGRFGELELQYAAVDQLSRLVLPDTQLFGLHGKFLTPVISQKHRNKIKGRQNNYLLTREALIY